MTEPPDGGRARLRGEAIRQCFPERERYRCDWQGLLDEYQRRILDLSDPFATSSSWRDGIGPRDTYSSTFADMVYFRNGPWTPRPAEANEVNVEG
jgi:hypothetical protein